MKEKYKLILIILGVIFLMGVIVQAFLSPATSKLQQQSTIEENIPLTVTEFQMSRTEVQSKQNVNVIEQPAYSPPQEIKPLVLPLEMQSYLDKHLELATERLNADIAEQKARAWNAGQAEKLHDAMSSIGINEPPVRVEQKNTSNVSTKMSSPVSNVDAISVRSIVEVNGQFTARLLWKGRLKKVSMGDRLGSIRIQKITRDSVVVRDTSGTYLIGVRNN